MKFHSAFTLLGGLSSLTMAKPTTRINNPNIFTMVKTCGATGLSGACSVDINTSKELCQSTARVGLYHGFQSIQVYDHFQCDVYTDFTCSGTSMHLETGTYPKFGITGNSYRCSPI
ncbi:hypothetical protein SUNI508_09799 [Seiridium unicorne]|uniref:Uncharacterized protein n=1 Tax=Seiridium unicorne TaxID=138068 RepID=A0ABR2UN81_9PEZI